MRAAAASPLAIFFLPVPLHPAITVNPRPPRHLPPPVPGERRPSTKEFFLDRHLTWIAQRSSQVKVYSSRRQESHVQRRRVTGAGAGARGCGPHHPPVSRKSPARGQSSFGCVVQTRQFLFVFSLRCVGFFLYQTLQPLLRNYCILKQEALSFC